MKRSQNNRSKVKKRSVNDRTAPPAASNRTGQSGGSPGHSSASKPTRPDRKHNTNRGKKFHVEVLTPDEFRLLIRGCSPRCPTGIRNRAILVMLYRGAMRLNECLSLMPKDVDLTTGEVTILHGKGGKSRRVALCPESLGIVARWFERRERIGLNGRHRLFATLKGKPIWSPYIRNLVKRLAIKSKIEKRVHPHSLRHSAAFEMAGENVPLHVIQAVLGHSSLAVTSRYVEHLNPREVLETMRARPWKLSRRGKSR